MFHRRNAFLPCLPLATSSKSSAMLTNTRLAASTRRCPNAHSLGSRRGPSGRADRRSSTRKSRGRRLHWQKSVTENMWRHVTSATLCSNRTASTLSSTPAGDAWTCEILVADSILTLPDIGVVLPLAEPREDRLRGARALRSGSQIRAGLTFSSPRALAPSPARPEASVGDVRPPSLIFGPLNALNAQPGIVTPRRACGPSGGPVVEGDG